MKYFKVEERNGHVHVYRIDQIVGLDFFPAQTSQTSEVTNRDATGFNKQDELWIRVDGRNLRPYIGKDARRVLDEFLIFIREPEPETVT